MALNALGRLEVVFTFRDQSQAGTKSAAKNINQLEKSATASAGRIKNSFMGAFPALLTINIFRQVAAGAAAALQPTIEYGDAMRKLAAFSNLTKEEFAEFRDEQIKHVRTMGLITGKSTPEMINALTEMSKKGLDAKAAIAALVPTTILATLAQQDAAETSELTTKLYNALGQRGGLLTKRMNQLTVAVKESELGFDELAGVVSRAAGGLAVADPKFEDFIFLLTQTRNIAESGATAGTQMRLAYEKFGRRADEISALLEVNTRVTKDGSLRLRDFSEVLFKAAAKHGMPQFESKLTELNALLGSRAFKAGAGVALSLRNAFREAGGDVDRAGEIFFKTKGKIENADAAMADILRTMIEGNPAMMFDRLSRAIEQIGEKGAGSLIPSLNAIVTGLTKLAIFVGDVFEKFAQWNTALKENAPAVAALIGIVGKGVGVFTAFLAVVGLGRAFAMLFSSAIQFTLMPLKNQYNAVKTLTAATQENTVARETNSAAIGKQMVMLNGMNAAALRNAAAVASTGKAARGAAAGFTIFGRSLTFVSRLLGPLSLVMAAVGVLTTAFGDFDDDIAQLNKLTGEAHGLVGSSTRDIRMAAGDLSEKIFASAARFEAIFKEKPPVLDAKTFTKLDDAVTRLGTRFDDPKQFQLIEPALREQAAIAENRFLEIRRKALAGEEVSTQEVLDASNAMQLLSTRFQEAGIAVGDTKLAELGKELAEARKGILTFNEGTEGRAKELDTLTGRSSEILAGRLGAGRDVFARRPETAVKREAEIEAKVADVGAAQRLNEAINTAAAIQVKNQRSMFEPFLRFLDKELNTNFVESPSAQLKSAREGILAKDPKTAKLLERLTKASEKTVRTLQSGIETRVEPGSGLEASVAQANASGSERDLNPGSGR